MEDFITKVLITGGAGFIGSHLADKILSLNYKHLLQVINQVCVIDNLSTGRIENIKNYLDDSNFKFYCDTILNKDLMGELVKQSDIIFHLAANVGVDRVNQTPSLTLQDDIEGTKIVLEKAKKYWKKVLLMSSSEVYGYSKSPLLESSVRLLPSLDLRSSYAEVKIINEMLAMAYHKEYGLPIIIIRLFNTTGERQLPDYGMVLPTFIKAILNYQPMIIYGDGKQSRCFSYVGDIVEVLWDIVKKEVYGQVFNLGSTRLISINDLTQKIHNLPNRKYVGERSFDVEERIPNIDKIKKALGYDPIKTSLEEIIKRMIDYEKEKMNNDE